MAERSGLRPAVKIAVQGLDKTFKQQRHPGGGAHGLDLDVMPGETLAVVGASGVGKSTLLHILGTLERPSNGKVLWEG